MRVRPGRLNAAIGGLFIMGSACFALGSVPAYANAVGFRRWLPHDRNWSAAVTQLAGTLFFNVSTLAALAHNASVQEQDRHVWRPDIYGSTLFLIASAFGILAVGTFWSWRPHSVPWRIAWLNMIGSVLFMFSALASFILPSSGDVINLRVDVAGTLFGALCFLIAAVLMFPAWRRAVHDADTAAQPV
jgi:hypothetical protein